MQAIKAVFDGVNFKPKQAIPVSGQYEVVITFVDDFPRTKFSRELIVLMMRCSL